MDVKDNLRHVEEEAQRAAVVAIMSRVTTQQPIAVSETVLMLETALKAAYERGVKHACDKMRDTGRIISYD